MKKTMEQRYDEYDEGVMQVSIHCGSFQFGMN